MTTDLLESLLGKTIGDYQLVTLVADGPFSWVFGALNNATDSKRIVKVAKPDEFIGKTTLSAAVEREPGPFPTGAYKFTTGSTTQVLPDAQQLLFFEHRKLAAGEDENVIKVHEYANLTDLSYYQMDYVEGLTVRQWIQFQPLSLDFGLQLTAALSRCTVWLSGHGDLKPDNMIWSQGKLSMFDPGYFGPLDAEPENVSYAAVTTPFYYPYLHCDDLFACGIVFWELAMGAHPLDGSRLQEEGSEIGEELQKLVRRREVIGQYFLSPLWNIEPPRRKKESISTAYEEFLLKAMKLKLDKQGNVDAGEGFASLDEMHERLAWLKENGQANF